MEYPAGPLLILGTLLLVASTVKLKAIVSAILWIRRYGPEHVSRLKEVEKDHELTQANFFASFAIHGAFWPFGVKDHRIKSLVERLKQDHRPVTRLAARGLDIARMVFFHYAGLSLSFAVFVVATAWVFQGQEYLSWLIAALILVSFLTNLAMAVELVLGELFLGAYHLYFHMQVEKPRAASALLVAVTFALCVYLTGVASVFGVHQLFGAFHGSILDAQQHPLNILVVIAYYALTTVTTTGYGDVAPCKLHGVLVSMGLQIEAFAVVLFVLALFVRAEKVT